MFSATLNGMGISIHTKLVLFLLASTIMAASCRNNSLSVIDKQPLNLITQSSTTTLDDTEEIQIMTPTPETIKEAPSSNPNADVTYVLALFNGETWTFSVTVSHPDTGWGDYSNGWDVIIPDGIVLKTDESDPFTRVLLHPHENEQPFTRSQSGIIVPEGINQLLVRAHDIVDGFGGAEILIDLEKESGEGFEINR